MPTQTNQPTGLYLHLGQDNSPAYEEKCKACGNDNKCHSCIYYGNEHRFKECVQSDTMSLGRCNSYKCLFCHGTGHVLKRVEGAVEAKVQHVDRGYLDYIWYSTLDDIYGGRTLEELIDVLIAAYRDDTLPTALREGLREEDAE